MRGIFRADVVVAGEAEGETLKSTVPLSFWGGYDQNTGEIIDRRHPLSGQNAARKVLVVPSTRGSSTTAAVLLEAVRRGTAPAAVLSRRRDTFVSLASIVADEMHGTPVPILALGAEDFDRLETGQRVAVARDGTVTILSEGATSAQSDRRSPADADAGGGAGSPGRG